MSIQRRDLLLGSVGSALVFGMQGPALFLGTAQAQAAAKFFQYKVGDMDAFSLNEGAIERKLDASFIGNVSLEDVKRAISTDKAVPDSYTNPFTVTALRINGKLILFDTGFGSYGPPSTGKLAESMKAAGLDPTAVATIVVSHFHPDHILGLWVKGSNDQAFPNSEILMPEAEYKFWNEPSAVEKAPENIRPLIRRLQASFPSWKNIRQFADGSEVVPGVWAVATPGHTFGHTSFLVASGRQQLFVQSDVTGFDRLFVRNPGWHSRLDMDGPLAEATRRKFFERVIAERGMIVGYHFGFPSAGTLSRDGNGYAFVPLTT